MYLYPESESQLTVLAPAKLNLFLEVLSRRSDGFHEIETFMTAISLFDSLHFTSTTDDRIRLRCQWVAGRRARSQPRTGSRRSADALAESPLAESPLADAPGNGAEAELPTGEDNLVVRALQRLRDRSGTSAGMSVRLLKRIPAAAGLGGASSDAAAALLAGNRLWNLGLSPAELHAEAAAIGSDVPFFLRGGAAICRGRGERIEAVPATARCDYVVAHPPAGLSTGAVYQRCQVGQQPRCVAPLHRAAVAGNRAALGSQLVNRLQPAAESLSPWIGRLRDQFQRLVGTAHQMSGSGSSYFGVCRNARQARRVARSLRAAGMERAWAVHSLNTPCPPWLMQTGEVV